MLKAMPDYLAERRLDLWQSEYSHCVNWDEEGQLNFEVIEFVYELGNFNMFGAFQAPETAQYYQSVVSELTQRGIFISGEFDVSAW